MIPSYRRRYRCRLIPFECVYDMNVTQIERPELKSGAAIRHEGLEHALCRSFNAPVKSTQLFHASPRRQRQQTDVITRLSLEQRASQRARVVPPLSPACPPQYGKPCLQGATSLRLCCNHKNVRNLILLTEGMNRKMVIFKQRVRARSVLRQNLSLNRPEPKPS